MPSFLHYPRLEIFLAQASFGVVCTAAAMALLSGGWQAYVALFVLVLVPLPVLCFMGAVLWSDLDLAVEGRDLAWYASDSVNATTAILLEFPIEPCECDEPCKDATDQFSPCDAPCDKNAELKSKQEQEPLSPSRNQQQQDVIAIPEKKWCFGYLNQMLQVC